MDILRDIYFRSTLWNPVLMVSFGLLRHLSACLPALSPVCVCVVCVCDRVRGIECMYVWCRLGIICSHGLYLYIVGMLNEEHHNTKHEAKNCRPINGRASMLHFISYRIHKINMLRCTRTMITFVYIVYVMMVSPQSSGVGMHSPYTVCSNVFIAAHSVWAELARATLFTTRTLDDEHIYCICEWQLYSVYSLVFLNHANILRMDRSINC